MNYNHWTQGIDLQLQHNIPHLTFKTYVRNLWDYSYRENGVSFAIIFQGIQGDVPTCEIVDGEETPISGNEPTFETITVQEYGVNRMWDSIPMEFLVADAQAPDVKITIEGLEVLCPDLNCDYSYITSVGAVTEQTLSGKSLTLIGTDLPTSDIVVKFGETACVSTTITSDGTTLSCELELFPAAGSHVPDVRGSNGRIDSSGVAPIDVSLTTSSVSPNSALNQNGGDPLTIVGTGFSSVASKNIIQFSDGTPCTVVTASDTEILCEPEAFD